MTATVWLNSVGKSEKNYKVLTSFLSESMFHFSVAQNPHQFRGERTPPKWCFSLPQNNIRVLQSWRGLLTSLFPRTVKAQAIRLKLWELNCQPRKEPRNYFKHSQLNYSVKHGNKFVLWTTGWFYVFLAFLRGVSLLLFFFLSPQNDVYSHPVWVFFALELKLK